MEPEDVDADPDEELLVDPPELPEPVPVTPAELPSVDESPLVLTPDVPPDPNVPVLSSSPPHPVATSAMPAMIPKIRETPTQLV